MRHKFLTRLIGTKPEEDKSLEAVTHLIIVVSSVTAAASVICVQVHNFQCHPWIKIIKGEGDNTSVRG